MRSRTSVVVVGLMFAASCADVVAPDRQRQAATVLCNDNQIAVCHSQGPGESTLCVGENALAAHLSHGDTEGPCAGDQLCSICGDGTISVDGVCVPEDPIVCGLGTELVGNECIAVVPTLHVPATATGEEGSTVQVTVHLAAPAAHRVRVDYSTVDGTATAGDEYIAATGSVTFEPGDTDALVDLQILDNVEIGSPDTMFDLVFFEPAGAELASDTVTVIVTDDGDTPTVYGYVASGFEGDTQNFVFWVVKGKLNHCAPGGISSSEFTVLDEPLTVRLGPPPASQQSALWGVDIETTGVVTIPVGQSFGQVPFGTIVDDAEVEGTERVLEQLISSDGGGQFDGKCIGIRGYIWDND